MNLRAKKALAARALGVGKGRIKFPQEGLDEIKDAITTQDMISLFKKKIVQVREVKGRLKNVKRTTRKGMGKIKKKVKNTKRDYVRKTRKLRKNISAMRKNKSISDEEYQRLRLDIRASKVKSKSHLNEHLKEMRKK